MTYMPLLCRIKREVKRPLSTNHSEVKTTFHDVVAINIEDDGGMEYITSNGGRIPAYQVDGVWPLRSKR